MTVGKPTHREMSFDPEILDTFADPDPFAFPGDELEDEPEAEREALRDMVRRIALFTLPQSRRGNDRVVRFRAGYIRWVALVYLTNRDLFEHKSQAELAEALSIAPCTLTKHINALRAAGVAYGASRPAGAGGGEGGGSFPGESES